MVEHDEESPEVSDLPLPPLPPGITLPPPPPPPSLTEDSDFDDHGNVSEEPEVDGNGEDDSGPTDFQSQWEKRRTSDSHLPLDSKDSMYGHIDRIATGEVGTLLDRFSDRFGSELDREIIVLRKQQQQDIRSVKPTVELIVGPTVEIEEESGEMESDDFIVFFDVVNNLLGDMPEDFINRFVKSDSFALFESVGADPGIVDEDTRRAFFVMINAELGDLPEDKINEFVESSGFEMFTLMGEKYGG